MNMDMVLGGCITLATVGMIYIFQLWVKDVADHAPRFVRIDEWICKVRDEAKAGHDELESDTEELEERVERLESSRPTPTPEVSP